MRATLALLLVFALVLTAACEGDMTVIYPAAPTSEATTTAPPNTPVNPVTNLIEYRVSGNPTGAQIRWSNPIDGLTSVTTGLPYNTQFATAQGTMFLSLEATPIAYPFSVFTPFLSVQIFVNSILFREATSSEFTIRTLSVSGTWRK